MSIAAKQALKVRVTGALHRARMVAVLANVCASAAELQGAYAACETAFAHRGCY